MGQGWASNGSVGETAGRGSKRGAYTEEKPRQALSFLRAAEPGQAGNRSGTACAERRGQRCCWGSPAAERTAPQPSTVLTV